MHQILLTALAVAGAGPPGSQVNYGVEPGIFAAALKAPESPRRIGEGPRYCVVVDKARKAEPRRVCRTRRQWERLGVIPVV